MRTSIEHCKPIHFSEHFSQQFLISSVWLLPEQLCHQTPVPRGPTAEEETGKSFRQGNGKAEDCPSVGQGGRPELSHSWTSLELSHCHHHQPKLPQVASRHGQFVSAPEDEAQLLPQVTHSSPSLFFSIYLGNYCKSEILGRRSACCWEVICSQELLSSTSTPMRWPSGFWHGLCSSSLQTTELMPTPLGPPGWQSWLPAVSAGQVPAGCPADELGKRAALDPRTKIKAPCFRLGGGCEVACFCVVSLPPETNASAAQLEEFLWHCPRNKLLTRAAAPAP